MDHQLYFENFPLIFLYNSFKIFKTDPLSSGDHTPTTSSSRSRQPATEPTKKQSSCRYLSDDCGRPLSSARKRGSGCLAIDSSVCGRVSGSIGHDAFGSQESGGAVAGTKRSSKPGGGEPLSLLERIRKEAKKKRRKENACSTGKPSVSADNSSG